VRQWFNAIEHEQSVARGGRCSGANAAPGAHRDRPGPAGRASGFASVDELCLAISREELGRAASSRPCPGRRRRRAEPLPLARATQAIQAGQGKVLVVGVDSLLTSLAQCCRPIPPDEITGFVTRGAVVSVHRSALRQRACLARRMP